MATLETRLALLHPTERHYLRQRLSGIPDNLEDEFAS